MATSGASAEVPPTPDSPSSPKPVKQLSDQMITDLATEYSEYMKFDVSDEERQFEDSVEGMLSRLDEYCALVDAIRSDTTLCLQKTLPNIARTSAELEVIFQKIDALEAFVCMVKHNLNELEEQVNRAEEDMGQFSSIKKMFTSIPSFLTKKPSSKQSPAKAPRFVPKEIFHTEDYLKSSAYSEAASKTDSPDVTKSGAHTDSISPADEAVKLPAEDTKTVDENSDNTDSTTTENVDS